ncbi:hypothetical protein [Vibrio caribbeanicus]|uniref:hypothetical protein n=1 Tax=Vibrio caribbeanicus TaxID=701175 RepID=UPI0030D761DC
MRTYRTFGSVLLSMLLVGCATCTSDYKPKKDSGKIVAFGDGSDGAVEVNLDNSDVRVSMSAGNSTKEVFVDIKVTVTDELANINDVHFFPERLEFPQAEGKQKIKVIYNHTQQESKNAPVVLSRRIKISSESLLGNVEITFLPGAIRVGDKLSKGAQLSFDHSTTYRAVHDAVAMSFIQALFLQ